MSFVTAHVLDAVLGRPASGVAVKMTDADGTELAGDVTNADGRVTDFGPETLPPGQYRITFGTGDYFAAREVPTLYPVVTIDFHVESGQLHYHIPLLLSPFAYSTYRGS